MTSPVKNSETLEEAFTVVQWLMLRNRRPGDIAEWLKAVNVAPLWKDEWDVESVEAMIRIGSALDWNAPICASTLLIEKAAMLESQGIEVAKLPAL